MKRVRSSPSHSALYTLTQKPVHLLTETLYINSTGSSFPSGRRRSGEAGALVGLPERARPRSGEAEPWSGEAGPSLRRSGVPLAGARGRERGAGEAHVSAGPSPPPPLETEEAAPQRRRGQGGQAAVAERGEEEGPASGVRRAGGVGEGCWGRRMIFR